MKNTIVKYLTISSMNYKVYTIVFIPYCHFVWNSSIFLLLSRFLLFFFFFWWRKWFSQELGLIQHMIVRFCKSMWTSSAAYTTWADRTRGATLSNKVLKLYKSFLNRIVCKFYRCEVSSSWLCEVSSSFIISVTYNIHL